MAEQPPGAGTLYLSSFTMYPNGTAAFAVRISVTGNFTVTVRMKDSGGTAGGGSDTSKHMPFNLQVLPVSPILDSNSSIELFQRSASASLSPVVIPACFTIRSVQLGESLLPRSFAVTSITGDDVLAGTPFVDDSGSLHLTPRPLTNGVAVIYVKVTIAGNVYASPTSPPAPYTVYVRSVNRRPSFSVPARVASAEGSPRVLIPSFAGNITAGEGEGGQAYTFSVTSAVDYLFQELPALASDGTLSFKSAPGRHGETTVSVVMRDDGGTRGGGQDTSAPAKFSIKIYPLPRVTSVVPSLGPLGAATLITVSGVYFGSPYSRGFSSESYSDITVGVGGKSCPNVTWITDELLTCTIGTERLAVSGRDVEVTVNTAGLSLVGRGKSKNIVVESSTRKNSWTPNPES